MQINSIKLYSIIVVLTVLGIIWSSSPVVVTNAKTDDVADEIAAYKNWTRINTEPIKSVNEFIIDGDIGGG